MLQSDYRYLWREAIITAGVYGGVQHYWSPEKNTDSHTEENQTTLTKKKYMAYLRLKFMFVHDIHLVVQVPL